MTFAHDHLHVYKIAIAYVGWVAKTLRPQMKGKDSDLYNQIARASRSISANIAEGVGRWIPGDKIRFFRFAIGSAAECSSHMDAIEASGFADASFEGWNEAREQLVVIHSGVQGLITAAEKRKRGG